MQENLIGYLLGALDEDEMAQFEAELDRNVDLQRRVQDAARSLQVLEYVDVDDEPPVGLVEATCQAVTSSTVSVSRRKGARKRSSKSRPNRELAYDTESWSMIDMVVAASVFFVACLLFFPAINNSRFHAEIAGCQDNLMNVGRALIEYSGHSPQGTFPKIPKSGPLGVAGMYAPTLIEHGLITEDHEFFCPSTTSYRTNNVALTIPRISEIAAASPGPATAAMQKKMGGSYGFVLGIMEGDKVRGIRNQGRSNFALMTDTPVCETMPLKRELKKHCNVFFECGNVRVLPLNAQSWQGDRLYENDNGQNFAGVHDNDAVIGASAAKPLP